MLKWSPVHTEGYKSLIHCYLHAYESLGITDNHGSGYLRMIRYLMINMLKAINQLALAWSDCNYQPIKFHLN